MPSPVVRMAEGKVATVAAVSCGSRRRWQEGRRAAKRARGECAEIIRAAEDGRRAVKGSSAVPVYSLRERAEQ